MTIERCPYSYERYNMECQSCKTCWLRERCLWEKLCRVIQSAFPGQFEKYGIEIIGAGFSVDSDMPERRAPMFVLRGEVFDEVHVCFIRMVEEAIWEDADDPLSDMRPETKDSEMMLLLTEEAFTGMVRTAMLALVAEDSDELCELLKEHPNQYRKITIQEDDETGESILAII